MALNQFRLIQSINWFPDETKKKAVEVLRVCVGFMTIKVFVITNVKQKIKQTKNLKTFCFSKSLPFFFT